MANNTGRGPARNVFGKPGASHPDGSLSHVRVVEERSTPTAQAKLPMLTAHPRSGAGLLYPDGTLLTLQGGEPGDTSSNNYREVYETLPGPLLETIIATFSSSEFLVESRQRVALFTNYTRAEKTPTSTATGILSSRIEPEGDVVGWRVNRYYSSGAIDPTTKAYVVLDGSEGKAMPYNVHKVYDDENRTWIYTIEMDSVTDTFLTSTKIGDLWVTNGAEIFAHNALASVTVQEPGTGYTLSSPSTVTVEAPSTLATTQTQAVATIASLKAVDLVLVADGAGQSAATLNAALFFGGGTTIASNVAQVAVTLAAAETISITAAGTGYLPGDWIKGDGGTRDSETTTTATFFGLDQCNVYGTASRGYAVDDTITMPYTDADDEEPAILTVTAIYALGRVRSVEVTTPGRYVDNPSINTLVPTATSGSGNGLFRAQIFGGYWKVIDRVTTTSSAYVTLSVDTVGAASAVVVAAGSGYLPGQTLTAANGVFSVASVFNIASVKLLSGVITSVANRGSGMTLGQTITLGSGSEVTGTKPVVTVASVGVFSLATVLPGSGYIPGNNMTLDPTSGTAPTTTATASVATVKLISATRNAKGTGYAVGDVITLSNGTFTTATTQTVATVALVSTAINAGGAGYANMDTFTFDGGTGSAATGIVDSVDGGGAILTFTITSGGSYTVAPTTFTSTATIGGGTGATFQTALYGVNTSTLTTAGNYSDVSTVGNATTVLPTGGTGATYNTLVWGVLTITMSNQGEFAGTLPTAFNSTATSGGGSGATFNTPSWSCVGFNVTTPGAITAFSPNPPIVLTQSAGTGSGFVLGTLLFGVLTVTVGTAGVASTVTFPVTTTSSGAGTGATLTPTFAPITVTLTSGGRYLPTLITAFTQAETSGSGTGLTFNVTAWVPLELGITNGGVFTSLPSSPITLRTLASGGSTLDITGTPDYGINAVTVGTAGAGYRTAFIEVTVSGGSGTGAKLLGVADAAARIAANGYIVGGSIVEPDDMRTLKKTLIVSAIPPERIDHEPYGFEFPAQFELLVTNVFLYQRRPQLGRDYTLSPHKRATFNARIRRVFKIGDYAQADIPQAFALVSPGNASQFFPIPENCVHPEIDWEFFLSGDNTTQYEKFAASYPDYEVGDIITLKAWSQQWRGNIFEKIVYELAEDRQI